MICREAADGQSDPTQLKLGLLEDAIVLSSSLKDVLFYFYQITILFLTLVGAISIFEDFYFSVGQGIHPNRFYFQNTDWPLVADHYFGCKELRLLMGLVITLQGFLKLTNEVEWLKESFFCFLFRVMQLVSGPSVQTELHVIALFVDIQRSDDFFLGFPPSFWLELYLAPEFDHLDLKILIIQGIVDLYGRHLRHNSILLNNNSFLLLPKPLLSLLGNLRDLNIQTLSIYRVFLVCLDCKIWRVKLMLYVDVEKCLLYIAKLFLMLVTLVSVEILRRLLSPQDSFGCLPPRFAIRRPPAPIRLIVLMRILVVLSDLSYIAILLIPSYMNYLPMAVLVTKNTHVQFFLSQRLVLLGIT